MRLSDSYRFKEEYKIFSESISKITDENIKKELTGLLRKMVLEVRDIDDKHQEIINGNRIPGIISEKKESLLQIRKTLVAKLDECKKAGLIRTE